MKQLRRFAIVATAVATLIGVTGVIPVAEAQTTAGEFDRQDTFCVRKDPPVGRRNAASPGVTPDSITVADASVDDKILRRLGVNLSPYGDYNKAFIAEINERCGGINGRKIVLKSVYANALAVDQAAHYQANCIRITEDYKAFMQIGTGTPAGGFPRCVGVLHKTIALVGSPGALTADDYADAKGRIVSRYPAVDRQAAVFISDARKEGTFKDKKVAVIGLQTKATAVQEIRDQWIDPLKKIGVDAQLEVLPCIGTNCKAQMTAAVSRLKNAAVNLIIVSSYWYSSNIGALYKQMAEQRLAARLAGPFVANVHADAILPQQVADAGRDGMQWVSDNGSSALVMTEVDTPGTWRVGLKDTPFARMCQEVIARRMNQKALVLGEADATNWFAVTQTCENVRAMGRALASLGANVTTERMAAALATLDGESPTTMPNMRTKLFYSGRDVEPEKVTEVKLQFPCPFGTNRNTGCMLAVDRPVRVRNPR